MMNEGQMFEIFQAFFEKRYYNKIKNTLIIELDDGYELFGQYTIHKEKNVYVVKKYNTALYECFYNLKNATIFTILYERNKVTSCKRIQELDVLLESTHASLERYKTKFTTSKIAENRDISLAKFNEAKHKKYVIKTEIENYIKETKKWQESRFKQLVI